MTSHAGDLPPVLIRGMGMVCPNAMVTEMPLPRGSACGSFPVFMCPPGFSSSDVSPGVLRRLGRAQKMAVITAHQAVRDYRKTVSGCAKVAVAVGTGLAETGQTASFLENMIEMNEAQPKPTRFVNSVHNSLASQIAITLKCTGENHTFSHGFISFELALWQMLQAMRCGRADCALVCGADEVSPYLVSAGLELGWWTAGDAPGDRTLLGEGAATFLLTTDTGEEAREGVRLRAVGVQPLPGGAISPSHEVDFLQRTLARGGVSLDEVDVVLVGGQGTGEMAASYDRVFDAMETSVGTSIWSGAYKGVCGEFCTAAAIGLALASESIRHGGACEGIRGMGRGSDEMPAPSKVLLYHLYPTGYHSAILVTR